MKGFVRAISVSLLLSCAFSVRGDTLQTTIRESTDQTTVRESTDQTTLAESKDVSSSTRQQPGSTQIPKKPSTPRNFIATGQNFTSLNLSWNEPSEWNGDPVGYDLRVNTEADHEIFSIRLKERNNRHIRVTDLKAGNKYILYLTAVSQVDGEEVLSEIISLDAQTSKTGPPSAPRNFIASGQKYSSMHLTWNEPSEWNGEPVGYDLWLNEDNDTDLFSIRLKGKENRQFRVTNLKPGTNYTVYLRAVNLVEGKEVEGEIVEVLTETTNISRPSVVRNLQLVSQFPTNWTINWDQPDEWNGPPVGYRVIIASSQLNTTFLYGQDNTHYTYNTAYDINNSASVYAFITYDGERIFGQPATLYIPSYSSRAPSPPRNFRALNEDFGELILVWDQPLNWNGQEGGYVITSTDESGASMRVILKGEGITRFTPSGLKSGHPYKFNLTAFNIVSLQERDSQPAFLEVRPFPRERPQKPENLKVDKASSTSTSLTVSWDTVKDGEVDTYEVTHNGREAEITEYVNGSRLILTGLQPWSNYYISVTAVKFVGNNTIHSEAALTSAQTNSSAPSPPVSPTSSVTCTSITLRWSPPLFPNGPIRGYLVSWSDEEGKVRKITTIKTTYTITSLKPWSLYDLNITVYNSLSDPDLMSEPIGISTRTEISVPSAPRNLRVEEVSNTSMTVMWDRPDEPNGPISGYFVGDLNQTGESYIVKNETFMFENLDPWTNYTVSVVAFNDAGNNRLLSPNLTLEERTSASAPPYSTTKLTIGSTEKESAILSFPLHLFSHEHGDIVEYVLMIAASTSKSNTQDQGYQTLNETSFPNWKGAKNTDLWYRSSHEQWDIDTDASMCSSNGTSRKCIIGKDKTCSDKDEYCDAPLTPDTQYWAKIRAYTVAGWTETFPVTFKTAPNGSRRPTLGVAMFLLMTAIAIIRT